MPQGSHLGPVLFTVFINDLSSAVRAPTELYADDALLHQVISRTYPLEVLQASLSAASSWATCWNGRFSPEKTVLMEIKPSNSASTPLSPVLLEGQPVNIPVHHKHLGITFQSDLSWSAHLEKLISKGTQCAGLLKLMSRTLPSQGVIYPVSHRSLRIKFWALRTNCEMQSKKVRIKKIICEAEQSMHRRFAAACAIAIACMISPKLRSAATAQPGAGPELASSGLLLITRSFLILARIRFGTAGQGDLLGDAAFSRWKTFSKWQ